MKEKDDVNHDGTSNDVELDIADLRELPSDEELDIQEITEYGTGIKVDIKRVKSAYRKKTHNETNLPNVLAEYGMEDEKERDRKERVRKYRSKSQKSPKHLDDPEVLEKRRKRREESRARRPQKPIYLRENSRYAALMEQQKSNPNALNQFYSKKVSTMMRSLSTPRQDPMDALKGLDDEEDKKPEKQVFKKQLEKHTLSTDNSFLRGIHRSDVAKVVELQDKLIREGKLKTQGDIDRFRQEMKDPSVFSAQFNTNNNKKQSDVGTVAASNVPSVTTSQQPKDQDPLRSLSHISETSRPVTREDWAITHQFPAKNEEKKDTSTKKQNALDLEKRFPKPVMPPLKCFTMELGEKPPDPEELQRQAELRVRIKQRKKFLRKLHRMHQMAMAHGAAAARILENHGEIGNVLDGNSLRDVRDMYCGIQNFLSVLPAPEDNYIAPDDLIVPLPGDAMSAGSRPPASSQGSYRSRASLQSRESRRTQSRDSQRPPRRALRSREETRPGATVLPLTMEEIRDKCRIVEAKCLSTNWTNYMRAGRKVSAV